MNKKSILLIISGLVLLYPVFSVFYLKQILEDSADIILTQHRLRNFQISVWLSWVILVSIAVYFKWTRANNLFFYFTYVFLLIFFGVFGYYAQMTANHLDAPTGFKNNYTFGVLIALQNFVVAIGFTAILQACVWWFTRRWHRRMK